VSPFRQLVRGLRTLFDRPTADADVADEVQHYLEQATAAHAARGLSPDDARRAARLELGNVTGVREQVRGYGWENVVASLLAARDLRIAIRGFMRTPGFTITALLTLALSLGANLTIFAVIDSVLLRPLPFPGADRLIAVFNTYPRAGVDRDGSSVANYYERRGHIPAFSSVALYRYGAATVGASGATERTGVVRITPDFFTTLGVGPVRGRGFLEQEMDPGANDVVLLTDQYWRERFNGDTNVVGRTVRIDGVQKTIVGVLPRDFRFLSSKAALFLPLASSTEQRSSSERHSGSNSEMIGRLRDGVSIADAQSQIDAQNATLEENDPEAKAMADAGFRSIVLSLHGDHVASIRPTLLLLQSAVLLLVLIATVNLANLLSIRASARSKELMIRQSIGATRAHLMSQVLVETLTLTLAGGLLGLLVGAGGVRLIGVIGVDQLPLGAQVAFTVRVALVTLAAASLLGVLIAVPIAWLHVRGDLAASLKSESRGGTAARATTRVRSGFIVAQVALAFVLLSGSIMLGLSLERAMETPRGFQADRVSSGEISLPARTYATVPSLVAVTDRVVEAMRGQPGVIAVGVITNIPLSGNNIKSAVNARGYVPRAGESLRGHYSYGVTGDYFTALRIPLREGRYIGSADVQRAERVCVVDEDFARRYWPTGSAVGHQIFRGGDDTTDARAFTIVGVVGAVKQADVTEAQAQGAAYFPFQWRADGDLFIVTRTKQDPAAFATVMAKVVRTLDPDLSVARVQSMDARVSDSLGARRSSALLAMIFACVALMLAAIGTYGVLSYAVAQRRREIGVRLALGAQPRQIGSQFLTRGVSLLGLGVVIGLVGTWMVGRVMERVLFDVTPLDMTALAGATAIISVVSLAASVIPARRAARIDPLLALAAE
jgi:predicted permease